MTELPQEEVLPGYPDETFVTYRGMRIFYKFKAQYQEWFVLVTRIEQEAISGYPAIGCEWFQTREDCIKWGKGLIDAARDRQ